MKALTHIRLYKLTRDKINALANKWETTQAEAIDRILLSAESVNFDTEPSINKIEKVVQKNTNRIIGFLKTQDKNLLQVQDNILYKIGGQRPPNNAEKKEEEFKNYLIAVLTNMESQLLKNLNELRHTNGKPDFKKMSQNENKITFIQQEIRCYQNIRQSIAGCYEEFCKKYKDALESE